MPRPIGGHVMQGKKLLIFATLLLTFLFIPQSGEAEEIRSQFRTAHGGDYHIDTLSTTEITGLWWNEDQSGWGITLTQQYDIIFATMFTYNQDGTPKWYVASNCAVVDNSCSGELYEISSGSALSSTWDGTNILVNAVGHISFLFSDKDTATVDFTIDQVAGTRSITRQVFSTLSPDAPYTALWWNANESGWGVTLTQQTDIAFITMFTYDNGGLPIWYVASNCAVTGNSCTGPLYEVTGVSSISQTWNNSNRVITDIGEVTFDFADPGNGVLNYEINGMSGTRSITRQVWANSATTNSLTAGLRDFALPLPLFSSASAWNQSVLTADVLPNSEVSILTTYRVLRGDITDQRPLGSVEAFNWPFVVLNFNEWTVPIYRGGGAEYDLLLCDYEGSRSWPDTRKFNDQDIEEIGGPVTIPGPVGGVRPSTPTGDFSDGHLVLYDPDTGISHEFWQATTLRAGECMSRGGGLTGIAIPEAGTIDFFDTTGSGTNEVDTYSARASGVSLMAGLFIPEDLADGEIKHALVFAIPGPRNLSDEPNNILASDIAYPASVTESDFYSINPNALISGQRLRLKDLIRDDEGTEIDESQLIPITKIFLKALREYGAYVVDNAGGFSFAAEDVHTGWLNLSDEQTNSLLGVASDTPIAADKTKWQVVLEALDADLTNLPIATGPWEDEQDPATATIDYANFEVVENATEPAP
jgi:hypothetical protein